MKDLQPEIALTGFLQTMWEIQAKRVQEGQRKVSYAELEQAIINLPTPRKFSRSLQENENSLVTIIAEVKRASPSKGPLFPDAKAGELADRYEKAGAAAISVLTEENYFLGSLEDLREVSSRATIPVMRKDFLIDPYQILEARCYGADACLLIAAFLGPTCLAEMCAAALQYELQPLIEIHGEEDLQWTLQAVEQNRKNHPQWTPVLGINARNLSTLTVDKEQVLRLGAALPRDTVKVAESGIKTREDVERAAAAGYDTILVGEALVTSPDPGEAIRQLTGKGVC
ncbi:indole-3-glycerol-phosphate synthase [Heliobacterium chlorum]|uniref:indole-3-glycerol-phosphate synthase n=1 Tax=Heliobacterium chlorum TaxID=2698 RepID=A0ABR7SX43_HELCL|nr:indole-3-glycerol phosphate synthase TrpC [Heliobacterium chlorum]MBC9783123.1 indole-3-glycerol-phosphate synthase [Heliobacterium chlorum]